MEKAEKVRRWLLERVGNPYIMGATGQFCTVSYRKARAAQYPNSAGNIEKYCQRMNGQETSCKGCRYYDEVAGTGKRAYDCAQLTRWAMDSVGITLVSGATSQWRKTKWAEMGEIATIPHDRMCIVFRQDDKNTMGHVGIAIGDGSCVHAKGHAYGVVREGVKDYGRWTHWAIPEGLYDDYTEQDTETEFALMKGDKGELVIELQKMLMKAGMILPRYGADGDYGNETFAAVMSWQAKKGLADTGVCDIETWDALKDEVLSMEETETITIKKETWDALVNALHEVNRMLGGVSGAGCD